LRQLLNHGVNFFGHDAGLVLAGRVLHNLNGFALSILLVHKTGLAGVGTFTVASVAVALVTLFCGLGLVHALPREEGSRSQKNTFALLASLIALLLGFPLVAVYGAALGQDANEALAITLFAVGGFYFAQINILTTLLLLQNRPLLTLVPPTIGALGIVAMLWLDTLVEMALLLALTRVLGVALVFAFLPYARLTLAQARGYTVAGAGFLPMDILILAADQLALLAVTHILSREALGIFGLCRQIITAADTPAWSFVQSKYSELVETRLAILPELEIRVKQLSMVCAAASMVFSGLVGTFVYDLPLFALYMALPLISLPARYLATLYDQALRAVGWIAPANRVAAVRFVLAISMLPGGAAVFGVWGALGATALLSIAALLLVRPLARPLVRAARGI
jgi:hypothetical protein